MSSVERAMRGVVFTGAQQIEQMEFCGTGTPYDALRRLKIFCDDRIALLGQGTVGLTAAQLAASMGDRVIALGVSPKRWRAPGNSALGRMSTRGRTTRSEQSRI
jgi:D-arabinose 1-dehydrogenase-like Zn-dependent alcohol dehydrogenase